jgi:peptide/nickel transport system substrate-binding protein
MKKDLLRFVPSVGLLVLTILLLPVLDIAAQSAEKQPRYGGTLRVTDIYDGFSFGYPPKLTTVYGYRQAAPAIETLFRTDKAGKTIPYLATGVKDDVKAKTITLTLRKGVKFHDGTNFNAEAVKWNLDQCVQAGTYGTEKIKAVDVVNDVTVRINLSEWDSTIQSLLSMNLGMMISPTAYKKNGEEWCAKHPVGTGPFEFVSWDKDVRTTYKKFADYWQKGKPYVDRVEWVPISDTLTRQLSFRRGEQDLILSVPQKDVAAIEKDGYDIARQRVGSGAVSLIPDSANPKSPWADVRVRQAAQYAIDGAALVKSIYYGEGEVTNQWIYKASWAYNPSVVGYPYNPAKARQLLAAAGYPNGFKTKLLYRTNPQDDQLFTAVQGFLQAVGIQADLDPAQTARYNQISSQGASWEGLVVDAVKPSPDVTAALSQQYMGGDKNFVSMATPKDYLDAVQKAITAPDFKTKQKWTREALKLMADKYCLQIILLCRLESAASQKYLHNHGFNATPNTAWWTPEEAWLEK